ncbi:probable methyltransferase-like protein 25 [Aethina tumida]|uniref:probable methyltransferase-like protein 25 n=1 Tax=Aethina tumida TaxID=116153 RepID=UPI002147C9FC|nr:probable methyltransferase-like protein 25 [Aethina tumida]
MTQIQSLRHNIESLVAFLEPFLAFSNCHMVDYFSQNSYIRFIPKEIRQEIESVGQEQTVNLLFNNDLEKLPHLNKYVQTCNKFRTKNLTELCIDIGQLNKKLDEFGGNNVESLKLDIFMTSKKSHEVEILSNVAAAVRSIAKTSHTIDIGDGKGYLSSMLALHYKIPVLGIDASEINTNSAVKRVDKLAKVWNSVTSGEKTRSTSKDLYKQITKFVDENVNFKDLIEHIFLEEPNGIGLVGLHTCGNLATASLKIFNSSSHIRTICNVGCCYHFITEEFDEDSNIFHKNKINDYGFPLSTFLKEKRFKLGRNARMVAAQSVDRIFYYKELPSSSIFYRALLEIMMKTMHPNIKLKDVGRFRKPAVDFLDYYKKALKRLNLEIDMEDKVINDFFDTHKHRVHELNVFYLIRCMLAPVIENLILLDRLLYLLESGHSKSFLVQLFDPVVSPRCYGIIAIK